MDPVCDCLAHRVKRAIDTCECWECEKCATKACPYKSPDHYVGEKCATCQQYEAYPDVEEHVKHREWVLNVRTLVERMCYSRILELKMRSGQRMELLERAVGKHGVDGLARVAETNNAMELYWEEDEVIHILFLAGMLSVDEWEELLSARP